MDQTTLEKREKLFRLAFSSTHDGEILNAVRKLKDLGVTSLPQSSQKSPRFDEKTVSTLIQSNTLLRSAVMSRDRLIGKLEDQISGLNSIKRNTEKKISLLESKLFFLKSVFYICVLVISLLIIF